MSRRVYTEEDVRVLRSANISTPQTADETLTQILKYIPAEIIAAFLAIDGIFQSMKTPIMWQWVIFFVILVLTPIYLWKVTNDNNLNAAKGQMVVGFLAFFVWVFTIGGPFVSFGESYTANAYWGSIGIFLCTVVFPIILGKTTSGLRKNPGSSPL
jgi:uncharacterized membrane protein YgaE (UPF0421/DUF939 family)